MGAIWISIIGNVEESIFVFLKASILKNGESAFFGSPVAKQKGKRKKKWFGTFVLSISFQGNSGLSIFSSFIWSMPILTSPERSSYARIDAFKSECKTAFRNLKTKKTDWTFQLKAQNRFVQRSRYQRIGKLFQDHIDFGAEQLIPGHVDATVELFFAPSNHQGIVVDTNLGVKDPAIVQTSLM